MSIRFDADKATRLLCEALVRAYEQLGTQTSEAMKAALRASWGPHDWIGDVEREIGRSVRFDAANPSLFFVEVGLLHVQDEDDEFEFNRLWKAMVINYGTGNAMAPGAQNPWLDAYKASDYWNKRRGGAAGGKSGILTRPGDLFYDPDLGMTPSNADSEWELARGMEHPPAFWFENALRLYFTDAQVDRALQAAFEGWVLGECVVARGD